MKVRYTDRAFGDREQIFDYIEQRNPQGALNVLRVIRQRINGIGDHPHQGTKTTRPGVYKLWLAPYPYRVHYRIDDNEVVILHIRHTSRRPW
jgi:toxin ParE1/3/4